MKDMINCINHYNVDEINNANTSLLHFVISVVIPVIGLWISYLFYKKYEISKARNCFFVSALVEWVYLYNYGHNFISDHFYPHIISELGFLIIIIFLIEPIRDALKAKAIEAKIINDNDVIPKITIESNDNNTNIEFENVENMKEIRKVIRAILTSSYNFRTVNGIAKQVKLDESKVKSILDVLLKNNYAIRVKDERGKELWGIII